ncbi:DinB family protein [Chryseolinea sp. T2]|uniref:DinB family protein n=1 Tax=Chryseolinea sp. T2 TaxID=3129255 RepID=UPI003077C8B0
MTRRKQQILRAHFLAATLTFSIYDPHAVNHATYHGGQLVTMLRQAGFSSFSNTDLVTYFINQPVLVNIANDA